MHRLRTFGLVDLRDPEGRELLPSTGETRPLALLAYLAAARPAGSHRRDKLGALLWPDSPPAEQRESLDDALDILRTALGEPVIAEVDDGSVALDSGHCWCDAGVFRAALDTGDTAEALALYRGDFLQGFVVASPAYQRWMRAERSMLRRQAAHGARELADQHESRGQLTSAVTWAKRGVELQYDDERALRRLLRLLDRAGDRKTALRIYERFSRKLRDGLKREPAPLTTELVARIRRAAAATNQEPGSARVAPARPIDPPRSPTEHRL